ncbi:MAG: alpha-D-ribose 1-methylphosphonate 5-triphosphate diphosphatase [Alphaproteobacteria bacterium]|nr:alpha-D-ribose 1-methylphosphonate 5-triphosphate diphosphatase [Alphaproteobacteria bacterium]
MKTALRLGNAQLVLPDGVRRGAVVCGEGAIAAIDEGAGSAAQALDLEGDYLLPGFVELHTDDLERHVTPRPAVRWPTLPALLVHDAEVAAAGITTVCDALRAGIMSSETWSRLDMLHDTVAGIARCQDGGLLRSEHLLHMRCEVASDNVMEMFQPFLGNRLLRLVSVMDHTPGARQFRNVDYWKVYYRGRYQFSEAEIDRMIAERLDLQGRNSERHRQAIAGACKGCDVVLASHDDTLAEHIDEARALGLTISEFPTTLEAAEAAHAQGMTTVGGAPNMVRGGSHSGNVAAMDLARAGLLDALSSDYVPASLLHAAFLMHRQVGLPLQQAVATISVNPARMLGLADRGEIAVGQRADLVRVALCDGLPVVRQVWRSGRRVV